MPRGGSAAPDLNLSQHHVFTSGDPRARKPGQFFRLDFVPIIEAHSSPPQFRALSTKRFSESHGIIALRRPPTTSIGCCFPSSVSCRNRERPFACSSIHSRAKSPDRISDSKWHMRRLVSGPITRGPRVIPPSGAVLEIEKRFSEIPPSYINPTIIFIWCKHQK